MKLYSPLKGDFYEKEIDKDGWVNTARDPLPLAGGDLAQYKDSIESTLDWYLFGGENLMECLTQSEIPT